MGRSGPMGSRGPEARIINGRGAARAPGSGCPHPNARRRGVGPAAIRLPPLSSLEDRPSQRHVGGEAFVNCDIGPQGGGYRWPVTPEGGYRPWLAPKCLVQKLANGQLSTVHDDARRERRGFCGSRPEGLDTVPARRGRRQRDARTPPRRRRLAAGRVFWTPQNSGVGCGHGAAYREVAHGRSTSTTGSRNGHGRLIFDVIQ
jgi:hypothetical protein